MGIAETISARRKELGLSAQEIASKSGLYLSEYRDAEECDKEIFDVVKLRSLKRLCNLLALDMLKLFEIPCVFCAATSDNRAIYRQFRNALIYHVRNEKGWSLDDLSKRTGWYKSALQKVESEPDYLESADLSSIRLLANALDIPLQVLLAIKCSDCSL